MAPAILGLRWSTSTPITSRRRAPASTGVATIEALLGVVEGQVLGDLHAQGAQQPTP